jgi:hypothetical protein
MSNRSRSDSGTSGSSASTNGSGRPPRRRSHRPRGCRGGSSRRSRNNSLDDKSAKKSIIQNNSNINSSSSNNNNSIAIANTTATATNMVQSSTLNYSNTHNSYHESSRRKGHDSSVKYSFDKSRKTDHVPIILTNPLQQRYGTEDQVYRLLDRPSKQLSSTGKPYSLYPQSGGSGHDSISNSTATTANGEESFSSLSRNPAMDFDLSSSFGYDTSSYYQQPASSFELPVLHQSYSDSSSEGMIFDHQNSYESHMNNDSGCHILPPMPSTEFLQNERPPVSTGPNPYALKLGSTHGNGYLPRHQQQNQSPARPQEMVKFMDTTNFASSAGRHHQNYHHQQTQQHKLKVGASGTQYNVHHQNNTMQPPQHQAHIHPGPQQYHRPHQQQPHSHQEFTFDYQTERLEKQRQNVEGGSLFVTSPRSFLMGFKKASPLALTA